MNMHAKHASLCLLVVVVSITAFSGSLPRSKQASIHSSDDVVAQGRALVLEYDCGGCHGGGSNPAAPNFLAGAKDSSDFTPIGPCALDPAAKPCFRTYARNLTPDNATGTGRYSERQIFNALRYGLKPSSTPDADITSATPGKGNFPASPHYLAPPMPWPWWRHMTDDELKAIAAYLKRGLRPVSHRVPPSEGPPDKWASEYTPDKIGTYPAPAYPAAMEVVAEGSTEFKQKVARGRTLVVRHACGGCHGGPDPASPDWLSGVRSPQGEFKIGTFTTRPRNLTPDNVTGLGRFSERQIFNALRYGLRPGETPDVEITSTTPGQGNFPLIPKYLAPPMPWPGWRHMSDADLWAVAAYLKHGVKPVRNRVQDSEGPPDFWASGYTAEIIGPHPAVPFPTANEIKQ
jgi:mono/diheme cytochrome c family protein